MTRQLKSLVLLGAAVAVVVACVAAIGSDNLTARTKGYNFTVNTSNTVLDLQSAFGFPIGSFPPVKAVSLENDDSVDRVWVNLNGLNATASGTNPQMTRLKPLQQKSLDNFQLPSRISAIAEGDGVTLRIEVLYP